MTWQQVFEFSYRGYTGVMKKLASEIGHDEFIPALQKAASEAVVERLKPLLAMAPNRDLATYAGYMKTEPIYRSALRYEVVEQSASTFEIHVSQCLWAKTFRAHDAAEIGYATICHPDYIATTTFNPKLKMIRTKTLMQGHDCCNHHWVMES